MLNLKDGSYYASSQINGKWTVFSDSWIFLSYREASLKDPVLP